MDGIIIINKPKNMTSHDVVGQLRKILKTKKIGHAGTLDPLATGVLVLGVGKATKLLQFLSADTKVYQATLTLGKATTTYDSEGEVLKERPYLDDLNEQEIKAVLKSFLGDSMQVPPIYSAIKKDGKKLYDYARNNEEVEIEARPIHISKIDLISHEKQKVVFEVCCSKGTYIRSLCVDIAKKLGYPGMMRDLVRLQSGSFKLEDALTLEEVKEGRSEFIGIDKALKDMPSLVIEDESIVYHGKKIKNACDCQVAVYNQQGHLLAVYGPDGKGYLKSVRGLW